MTNKETIYRQDVLDLAKKGVLISNGNHKSVCKAINELPSVNPQPCEDAISRQAVIDTTICDGISCNECSFNTCEDGQAGCLLKERVDKLPSVTPQPKTEQFAKWVAIEIFDENWEYNKDAFAEIACRKLAKLGIVVRMGDEWELVESQERSGEV